jgi:predicted nucleic acid-binding protein
VSRAVVLDSGPLGLVTNPKQSPIAVKCTRWLQTLIAREVRVVVPEIADYEIRRELLRANKVKGLAKLDALAELLEYLPLSTEAMRRAARFWAEARQQGQPTADDKTIDADVILAAQASTLQASDVVVATTNVGHLARFVSARLWQDIEAPVEEATPPFEKGGPLQGF